MANKGDGHGWHSPSSEVMPVPLLEPVWLSHSSLLSSWDRHSGPSGQTHRAWHKGGGGLKTWLEFLAVMPWVLAEGAKLFRVFLELGTSVAWSEQMPTWQGTQRTADPRLGDQATDTVGAAGSSHDASHNFSL